VVSSSKQGCLIESISCIVVATTGIISYKSGLEHTAAADCSRIVVDRKQADRNYSPGTTTDCRRLLELFLADFLL
jgi:hypothetical protein